jgi:CheY-like chemotaxis protein
VDVNQLVKGMDGMLRRVLPESVDIMLIKGAGLWSGYLDAGQMETALLNLAINARDAMVGHGHLTIETSNAYIDDDYANQHDEVKSGAYVLISVTDTGCGMDLQTLEQVFDPFFTTKQVGEGSGLGLSMVYGYIKQSGGHIKIYSEVNVGTTVKLYIPRAATAKTLATSQLRPTVTQGNGEHILVVEDDDLVRHYLEIQLRNLNYRVSIADSGPAALVIIQASDDLDLLFTDVADAARVIRPELRVLYTSGYTENAIVHQGRLDVGVELLSKPYRRQELEAKLNKIFGNKREV